MFTTIYNALKPHNVYPPGKHTGLCTEPYVVVKEKGLIPTVGNKLGNNLIDIILFVPIGSYPVMKTYRAAVVATLKTVSGLRKTGFETPQIPDNDVEAYTMSVEYTTLKRLEE